MRSIRLSLMVYFLVLLLLGLGPISIWSYERMRQTQEGKARYRQELLRELHDRDCKAERAKLDNCLLIQAWNLAGHAQFKYPDPSSPEAQYHIDLLPALSCLNLPLVPSSILAMPPWYKDLAQRDDHSSPTYRFRFFLAQIEVSENSIPKYDDEEGVAYFQINTLLAPPAGSSAEKRPVAWYSRSMEYEAFPFDSEKFASTEELITPTFDDTELEAGVSLRRVTLMATIPLFKLPVFSPARRPRPLFPPRANSSQPVKSPRILIQCAAQTERRDAALAALDAELAEKLDELTLESRTRLAETRNWLLLISLSLFATTMVGGFWLVRLGLSPLKKLSVAVSKVSAKDFSLPLEEEGLPRELLPIAERLTETLKALERAFAREKQAAADISHELRTPLAALLTTLEVGLRKHRSPDEYREMLNDCYAAGKQMSQLVERLLALARLDAGVDTLRPQTLDVNHLVEQCASLVRPLAEARGLRLEVRRNGSVQCRTDPNKLREVVTNLLHNAIEYNKPEGRVEVAVEQINGDLKLDVSDTGIGIAAEAFPHLFERFYRADPARQADGLHAGLGLAIVKGYVDLMSGSITVDSKEGEGTTFHVRLPIEPLAKKHG